MPVETRQNWVIQNNQWNLMNQTSQAPGSLSHRLQQPETKLFNLQN